MNAERRRLSALQETLLLVLAAVVAVFICTHFFVRAFFIPSGSMEPGLQVNDRILVEKPSYWFGGPSRGDVVVFSDPGGWLPAESGSSGPRGVTGLLAKIGLYPSGGHLVKRVIGVGGDTIVCCDGQGRLQVDGHALDERAYATPGLQNGKPCFGPMIAGCHWTAGPVPKGYLFVMGDNRANSADSTVHLCTPAVTECSDSPYVPVDNVVGKVFALVWPLARFDWLGRPDSFSVVP